MSLSTSAYLRIGHLSTHVLADPRYKSSARSSNILVGLISQLDFFSDGSTPLPPGSKARLSHLPLSLILTRGRPALTLALVGSSPLWQPLDELESRGYDVCLLQRVRASLDVGPSGASSAEEDSAGSSSHRRRRAVMKEQAVDE